MLCLSGLILSFLHHGFLEWQDYFPQATQTLCHLSGHEKYSAFYQP